MAVKGSSRDRVAAVRKYRAWDWGGGMLVIDEKVKERLQKGYMAISLKNIFLSGCAH